MSYDAALGRYRGMPPVWWQRKAISRINRVHGKDVIDPNVDLDTLDTATEKRVRKVARALMKLEWRWDTARPGWLMCEHP